MLELHLVGNPERLRCLRVFSESDLQAHTVGNACTGMPVFPYQKKYTLVELYEDTITYIIIEKGNMHKSDIV